MIDRTALFLELTTRNQARLAVELPSLNIRREMDFRIALDQAREHDYDLADYVVQYGADRDLIEIQVIADIEAQRGKAFCHTPDGLTAITLTTRKRFCEFLREVHGITIKPSPIPSKIVSFAAHDAG